MTYLPCRSCLVSLVPLTWRVQCCLPWSALTRSWCPVRSPGPHAFLLRMHQSVCLQTGWPLRLASRHQPRQCTLSVSQRAHSAGLRPTCQMFLACDRACVREALDTSLSLEKQVPDLRGVRTSTWLGPLWSRFLLSSLTFGVRFQLVSLKNRTCKPMNTVQVPGSYQVRANKEEVGEYDSLFRYWSIEFWCSGPYFVHVTVVEFYAHGTFTQLLVSLFIE